MNYLFYFIHPAKYHAFRLTINQLKAKGHNVDVFIISKDITEELVRAEGWGYTNIFPEGRRIPHLHTYINAGINLVRTIYRLLNKIKIRYDLIITDDLATIVGRLKGIPTIFFTDDDLSAVPESVILVATANYILCPHVANMGKYSYKKIGYYGLKSLAHLHPNHFIPDRKRLKHDLQKIESVYFFIRCVSATSTHDVGKRGLEDEALKRIVSYLEKYGNIVISSERRLPMELQKYIIEFDKADVGHYIYHAAIFISDSTTMCAEACILGTPALEFDDWFADFQQYKMLNGEYRLIHGFSPSDVEGLINKLKEILATPNYKDMYRKRREEYIKKNIDLTAFMIWLFENYPESVEQYLRNPSIQYQFK